MEENFRDKRIRALFPVEKRSYLVLTQAHGMYQCAPEGAEEENCTPVYPHLTEMLKLLRPYHGTMLSDSTYTIGTSFGGIVWIDRLGRLLRVFNEESGLQVNRAWYVFQDMDDDLWIGLNNGISRIDLSSSLSYFDKTLGLEGTSAAITRHRGNLYSATSSGIYKLNTSKTGIEPRFFPFSRIKGQCWSLLSAGEALLAGCFNGVHVLGENGNSHTLFDDDVVFSLYRSHRDTTELYIGLRNGLALARLVKGAWQFERRWEIDGSVRSMAEDLAGDLWLATSSDGVFKVSTSNSASRREISHYGIADGLPEGWIDISFLDSQVRFLSSQYPNLFVADFDHGKPVFKPDASLRTLLPRHDTYVGNMIESSNGSIWIFGSESSGVLLPAAEGAYRYRPAPLSLSRLRRVFALYDDSEGAIWAGGAKGLIRLGKEQIDRTSKPYSAWIRRISTRSDSLLLGGTQAAWPEQIKWPYTMHSIRISYASGSYKAPALTKYRTWLEGFEDDWTSWDNETNRDYTNLKEGFYTFNVQARDALGRLSTTAQVGIRIMPPWYRTVWAYLLWSSILFVVFIGSIGSYNKYQTRRLQARNRILESRVKERTEEIETQKEAIEEAYEELTVINKDLQRSQKSLEERTHQLQEALQANKEILGITAHDLKNPLGGIIGLLDIVLTDAREDPSTAYEHVEDHLPMAKEEAERMLQIVKDLLDKHREGGEITLRKERIILGDIVSTVLRWNHKQAQDKSIDLHYDTNATYVVDVDVPAIQRVLDNYVSNAIKYSQSETNIWVASEAVISSQGDGEPSRMVKVSVRDEGPGLTEEDKQKVFGKMQRLSAKPTAGEHSTGLGLYIAKQLVEAHGGEVGVDSFGGKGATFWFILPISPEIVAARVL